MPLEPFTALLLLVFLAATLLALCLWFLLTLGTRREAASKRDEREAWNAPTRLEPASNDDWRGQRVQAQRPKRREGDPFEQFIQGKGDEFDY